MSAGRVRVGLGIGDAFSRLDHETLALGFPPFAERVRFLETCCTALPALWRGETVTEPSLGMYRAALGPLGIAPPPLIIGGRSRRLMELAARHAEGWNCFTQEPKEFAALVDELTDMEASVRRGEPLRRSVYFFVDRVNGELGNAVDQFMRAGADEAMLVVTNASREAVLDLARQVL